MKLTTLFRLRKPDGTDPVNIEDFNDNFDVIDEELGKRLESTGNASDMTAAFAQASTRTNLKTGEKISASFGKIMKWFADMKTVAFSGSYSDLSNKPSIPSGAAASQAVANNCTTTAAGSVLDARQGKVLMDKTNQLSSEISQWEDITGKCNFGYYDAMISLGTSVYRNALLRLVCFRIALNANVSNQSIIADIADFPANSHPIMLVGSCNHETEGVSVDIRMADNSGNIISSHNKNVQISNPRYTGIILF